jgi:hypothetical protein
VFVHFTGVRGSAGLSPMAYVISPMPYAAGKAEIPYGGAGDDDKKSAKKSKKSAKKSMENKVGQAMTAMDWKMMAHAIAHAKGVKEMPIIGGAVTPHSRVSDGPDVIRWCLLPYALLGLSLPGVSEWLRGPYWVPSTGV